ncbi:hypothetical protein C8R46DRAFT_1346203 [Mycena filopes]|nr:hypothetical protein C8R46DRAFT_1346203 [Mycena filopes]
MLQHEIETSHLKDVSGLIPFLFPDECLPLSPSAILTALSASPSPLHDGTKWVGCPDLSQASRNGDVETALAVFLGSFSERVAQICRDAGKPLPKERIWTAKFATKQLVDAPNVRFPDLLCGNDPEYSWLSVQIHGELKSNDSSSLQTHALKQLLNGAYLMFSTQDNRRFIISPAFMGHQLRLFIFDRSGLVTAAPFDIHDHPETFVRVFTALMFTNDPAILGYDTSIGETKAGLRTIEVDGVIYTINATLFISDVIRGRGTVCWHVRSREGQDFVIKDNWADSSREYTEGEILQQAKGVNGIPKVVADVVVKIHDKEDSTHNLRSLITSPELKEACSLIETRIHRRLVLTPFGHPLSKFASRKELISIFIDVVTAHRDLYLAKVLHRDISVNNIMLVPSPKTWTSFKLPPTPSSVAALAGPHFLDVALTKPPPRASEDCVPRAIHRGLLIDLDYALVLNIDGSRGPTATGHRTGTLPFMAIDVLTDGVELSAHEPHHDLESLLYVFIWICIHYAGPNNSERQNFDIHDSPLKGWVEGPTYEDIGLTKYSSMSAPKFWERNVLRSFAPYFEPLKPCASAWRELFANDTLDHAAVLNVLQDALSTLEDPEQWSAKDDPEGYAVPEGKKRKRSKFDYLARINEEDEREHANDNRPHKISRSGNGDARAIQSEPDTRRTSIVRSMKPKQTRPSLVSRD